MKCFVCLCLQEVLEVGQLSELVQQLMRQFYQRTRFKPQRIIFYRDGVSEGQFKEVSHVPTNKIFLVMTSLSGLSVGSVSSRHSGKGGAK